MNVLVSGASMAGLSAAYWFARFGAAVTVVERADGIRRGGAPIDVRGEALDVAARMGILELVRAQRVRPTGPATVFDAAGEVVATMDLSWFANECEDDVEISRDRLNDILLGALEGEIGFKFGCSVEAVSDDGDGVDVTFSDGSRERYDLVVGADGLHSTVRRLVFGPEARFVRHMGFYVALVNLDPAVAWRPGMCSMPGLMVSVRDTGDGPYAMVLFRSEEIDYDYRDTGEQQRIVGARLAGHGVWELPRLREVFLDPSSSGFYFDAVSQVHMPAWTRGRIALIGDAAHCASLLSGMGTSLAMIAAERLATAWHESAGDLALAAEHFHDGLRPFVDKAQHMVSDSGGIMVPATESDLAARNSWLRELAAAHG